jgi:hypothetical protein
MKSKHKLMKRIFENQGMKVNFDSFGESVEEEIVQEGSWGYDREDVEWDRRADTLGGQMAHLLVNSPVARLVQNDFNIPGHVAKKEAEIWTDEVKAKVAKRPADILKRYEQMLQVLKQLAEAEKENPQIGGAFRTTNDWYQTTKGDLGYNRIGPMFDAVSQAADNLKEKGDKSASLVRQAAEQIGTLHSALENLVGHDATR